MSKKSPNTVDVEVGAKVRQFRMMRGLSQEKVAEACGITFQQVQKYERGTNRIGASRLTQIAAVLGVAVSEFFPSSEEGAAPVMSPDQVRAAVLIDQVPLSMRPVVFNVMRQFIEG